MYRTIGFYLVWVALPMVAGALGSIPTVANLDWYRTLDQPWFAPPEWVFGPVWTLLNILMGTAAFLVWRTPRHLPGRFRALALFCVHLTFYVLWSFLFFGLHAPGLALVDIFLLLGSIILLTMLFGRLSTVAAWLLSPYLAWVTFATVLNTFYLF